ncbi:MAG: acyltransferase domain-containing protein [Bacteroidales bacterium]|nr:acyltransferase domain-containing protein [Bacteroidales bacterium]
MTNSSLDKKSYKIKNLIPITARSKELLIGIAKQHIQMMDSNKELSLQDLCNLYSDTPQEQSVRCIIKASSTEDYKEKLNTLILDNNHKEIFISTNNPTKPIKIVFVYSGMGPQWWGMGWGLYHHFDVFKKVINQCDELIQKHAGWSLLNEMFRAEDTNNMSQTWLAQPANFAIQTGLTELWKHWGVVPDGVVGHSIGETTAFHVAGVHTFEQALMINVQRGKLQHTLEGEGKMLAIGINSNNIENYLKDNDQVRIAAINSCDSVTLVGDEVELNKIHEAIPYDIFKKYLNVSIPYHGHRMQKIKDALEYELNDLSFGNECDINLYSSVSGKRWNKNISPVQYWWNNTFEQVNFKSVIEEIIKCGYNTFIEIGPHKALLPSIKEITKHTDERYIILPSLNRDEAEFETIQKSLCTLFCLGVDVNLKKYNQDLYKKDSILQTK